MKRLLVLLVLGCALRASAQTTFPGGLDTTANFPNKNPGDVISSADHNNQNSALFAIEGAIGADATLTTNSLLNRLNQKANVSDLVDLTSKIINGTLNADQYPGGDIGAKINAAIADCDAQVGAGSFCRVTTPPGGAFQTTPIKITRSLTELDCQGALLVQPVAFTDVPIRINYATVGTQASTRLNNITVRNCRINNASQTSLSTQLGPSPPGTIADTRIARVVVWRVDNVRIEHVDVTSAFGPGVEIDQSNGSITDLNINTTRAPYTNGPATGLYVEGTNFGAGSSGVPVYADQVRVQNSASYGVHAATGAQLSNIDVSNATSACLTIGVSTLSQQGWVSLRDFTFDTCGKGGAGAVGAISDVTANHSVQLSYVVLTNGTIRNARYDGVRLGITGGSTVGATALLNTEISNVTVERFGAAAGLAHGIFIAPGGIYGSVGSYATVRGNTITNAGGANMVGIVVDGGDSVTVAGNNINTIGVGTSGTGVQITGSTPSRFVIKENVIRDVGGPGIELAPSVNGWLRDFAIQDNIFTTTPCVHFTGASPSYTNLYIVRNVLESLAEGAFGIVTDLTGTVSTVNAVVADNFFANATTNANTDVAQNNISSAIAFKFGAGLTGTAYGDRADTWMSVFNNGGATIANHSVVCAVSNVVVASCTTGSTARLALGLAAYAMPNASNGDVITRGTVSAVPCTGTVAVGDLLVRSTATNGSVMTNNTPGAGESIGKALSACTSGTLIMYVTVGG